MTAEVYQRSAFEYDPEVGFVREIFETVEREVIALTNVRAELQEEALREAVIAELELQGYTVRKRPTVADLYEKLSATHHPALESIQEHWNSRCVSIPVSDHEPNITRGDE